MDRTRLTRVGLFVVLSFTGACVFLLLLQCVALPLAVWFSPSLELFFYDLGVYGAYRSHVYNSFNLSSPRASILRWDDSCDNGVILLDINGPAVKHNGPAILDSRGSLIWTSDQFQTTMNSRIQRYRGQNFLTFWSGHKAKTSGAGDYYMLDSNYSVVHKVSAVGENLAADLHEFRITRDNTALITVYNLTNADLTQMGMFRGKNGWITDSVFQEIDIATGELLFEWRASDYFGAHESYMTNPIGGYSAKIPFDFAHINSIEKDSQGDYLVSIRHLHSVVCINGKTGEAKWTLGGNSDDFTDISDGGASDFGWQHDARWLSEEDGILSLFDNGVAWPHMDAPYSQGRVIQLDIENRTAQLLQSFTSLQHARSSSQGSLQLCSAGDGDPHIFIGWGSSALYNEYTFDGNLLCETHFGASSFYFWEQVKSYRAFKAPRSDWVASPTGWSPSAKIHDDTLYVSWNGATEVAFWELQGSLAQDAEGDHQFQAVDIIEKTLFEEAFALPTDGDYTHYRVAALDQHKTVLRYSNVEIPSLFGSESYLLAALSAGLCIVSAIGVWIVRRRSFHLRSCLEMLNVVRSIDRSKYLKLR